MPLSELYRLPKRRVDSNQDFEPGNDVFELVWENGQITAQGQSSRVRKDPTCNSLPSHCLPSYTPKSRDKDLVGNGTTNTRAGKFGTVVDSVLNEIPMSVPSDEVGLSHDDDMISWLNYPIDGPLQNEYCPDFLPELSGVTVHEISKSNTNFASNNDKSSCNQAFRDSNTNSMDYCASLVQRNVSKVVASAGGGDVIRPRIAASQLYPTSSSQQCQMLFPNFRSRVLDAVSDNNGSVAHHAICSDSARVACTSFPSQKMQKPDSIPPSTSSNVINFSHFSRPAALARANSNLQSMPSIEKVSNKDKGFAAHGSSPPKLGPVDSSGKLRKETGLQSQIVASSGIDLKPLDGRPLDEPSAGAKDSEAVCREDASKNDVNSNQIACESTTRGLLDGEKNMEPVVASSSVCSGNSVERASDEPTNVLKRKFRDAEDSECHSEEVTSVVHEPVEESKPINQSGVKEKSLEEVVANAVSKPVEESKQSEPEVTEKEPEKTVTEKPRSEVVTAASEPAEEAKQTVSEVKEKETEETLVESKTSEPEVKETVVTEPEEESKKAELEVKETEKTDQPKVEKETESQDEMTCAVHEPKPETEAKEKETENTEPQKPEEEVTTDVCKVAAEESQKETETEVKEEEQEKTELANKVEKEKAIDIQKSDRKLETLIKEGDQEEKDTKAASKDAVAAKEVQAKPAQKQSNNIISKVKHSLVKAKKAIIGKSPGKTTASEAKGDIKVK